MPRRSAAIDMQGLQLEPLPPIQCGAFLPRSAARADG
jgi:hypothetical protein